MGNTIDLNSSSQKIPNEFKEVINNSLKDALTTGILGGFAIIDINISVSSFEINEADSSELAFSSAAL